ncbi:MAG: hypothetical protein JRG96_14840 [Deltaproteobacteria bacterium]|nr:hypothetical protein [Deltaproteobacteria bacterium]MBW2417170.1 hypothetical protein [Deltaproteobacteria bacterium]
MGDVSVIHTRHRDTIPVQLSHPCDERIVVIPSLGAENRGFTGTMIHVNLLPPRTEIDKAHVD